MVRKREVLLPYNTFIVWPPYLAKQTLRLISVLSVMLYWLNLSLDSIKMMCGCSSQVAMLDVFVAILDNSFKTSTPLFNTVINETLWEFLPFGDYHSLQFFHRLELSLVADSLLKSTPNSVIHGINIRAIRRQHVRFNEVDVHRGPGDVRWRSILLQCPPVMTTNCSDVRQQTLLVDDTAVEWAVNFRFRIDEDHPRLPHTRYSDRHHDVATEA